MAIDRCPLEYAGPDALEVVSLAGLFRKGLAPAPGGVNDQAATFYDAARFVWSEEARWKAQIRERRPSE